MTPSADPERYKNHRFPGEIISHGVWLYYRFPLSYRDVQELLFERGIDVTHEAIRQWCLKFGQDYANQLKRRRAQPGDTWHLEIVFTPLIKTRGLAMGTRRDDVPHLPVAVVDQDASDQELHQGALLRTWGLSSSAPDTLTKCFHGRHHACPLSLPIDLRLPLRVLGCQGGLFLCQGLAPPLILCQWDHLPEIRLGQALELMGESRVRSAPGLFARL
jgi:hypothetical protein